MGMTEIDAAMLRKMFLAGADALEKKKEYINELNVFPVPDGDTGTNMTMTVLSAVQEVMRLEAPTIDALGKAISSGSLRGARGNSGVILSQIFRGFVRAVSGNETIDVMVLGNAVRHASETAYKAVMKPKEGTILTVASAGAHRAEELLPEAEITEIIPFCEEIVQSMEDALARTPEQLEVLKKAGVVDSGGEGLMTFLRGAVAALKGGKVRDFAVSEAAQGRTEAAVPAAEGAEEIRFGYCTEFIVLTRENSTAVEAQLKEYLQTIGDCVVVVADDGIVKVHVHTNDPGLAIQKGLAFGDLSNMKIDNMREEHNERLFPEKPKKEAKEQPKAAHKAAGFAVVSSGEGLSALFTELGADRLIEGGQTMNPSTEDILKAVARIPADTVFVLPNNGNILLSAQQAQQLSDEKKVVVIPSENIPQGIAAMIAYVDGKTDEENLSLMKEEMGHIKSGEVTNAIRDTEMEGRKISRGDFMGLSGKALLSLEKDAQRAALGLVEALLDEDAELVSLYYGDGITQEQAQDLADAVAQAHEELEVEVQYGGQPVYPYLISVE